MCRGPTEVRGAHTNKREVAGKDGAPLGPSAVVYTPENGRYGPEVVRREERAE